MALYELALEQFFDENPHLKNVCNKATETVESAVKDASMSDSVKQANTNFVQILT